jgi:pyridoxine/pyridoxamine 5'-phosphate oxidase
MDRAALHAFISRQRYGVVSSTSTNGTPQSALVGIAATSRLEIIFDTVKSSRKYPNLIRRPACSLVIGWTGEQTLQLEGIAEEPRGDALKQFQEVYFAEWPECREHMSWPGSAYFVVHPHWIRYSDYDQKQPLIEEFAKEALSFNS